MALLVVLFIVIPIAELYVIIKVGEWIGILPTLAILLGDALLGSWLLRHQGRSAWRRFNQKLDERRFPGKEVADGLLITVGGTLLLTPGFITDIAGLLLLIPPTRALIRRLLARFVTRRFAIVSGPAGWGYDRAGGAGPRPQGSPYDVEGTAHDVGDPPPPHEASGTELPPPRRP